MSTSKSTTAKPRKAAAKKVTSPVEPRPAEIPPEDVEVSSVSEWKKSNAPLTLPSGKRMKIRSVGFQAFMKAGIIPNSLMSVVQSAIDKGQKDPDLDVSSTEQVEDMMKMMDDVIVFVAVAPEVKPAPKQNERRSDDILYVDEIDEEDKTFIFGVCTGGTRNVEQFRKEQADSLAALQ